MTKTVALGSFPALQPAVDSLDAVFTAADVANKNQFKPTGKELIIAWNSGASPYTVTVTSAPDEKGRSGDITAYSLAAADIAVIGPLEIKGWRQTDGYVYWEASNVAVKFAVISLP